MASEGGVAGVGPKVDCVCQGVGATEGSVALQELEVSVGSSEFTEQARAMDKRNEKRRLAFIVNCCCSSRAA